VAFRDSNEDEERIAFFMARKGDLPCRLGRDEMRREGFSREVGEWDKRGHHGERVGKGVNTASVHQKVHAPHWMIATVGEGRLR